MRLTEDTISQGLLHADRAVRFACLQYFADGLSQNQTVMPVAIEALQRFGRSNAFSYSYPLAHLAQTEETLRWVIGELQTQPNRSEAERSYLDNLSRLLCQTDVNFLLPHKNVIRSVSGFSRDCLVPFTQRLELLSWDDDALWRELEVSATRASMRTTLARCVTRRASGSSKPLAARASVTASA